VKQQTYPRIEHVVMDGGSTDSSLEVLRNKGEGVYWESRPDKGQADALNRAFMKSSGEIIGWLNSDDAYFGPHVVAAAVDAFDAHPEVDIVFGHAVLVNAEGQILHSIWVPQFSTWWMQFVTVVIQPTAFIRRRAISDQFLNDHFQYSMDRELWLRLAPTSRFLRLPQILAIDRHHSQRKGETMGGVAAQEAILLSRMYGCRADGGGALGVILRIMTRAVGLTLIRRAVNGPYAFNGSVDSPFHLAIRQAAMRRKWMLTT
jgi:glycosyltransferase involved in cell wall biosynthesis